LNITRAVAKEKGLTRYPMAKPCIHGHLGDRMTSSATCCECLRITIASNKHRSAEAIERRKQNMARKQTDGRYNANKKRWINNNPEKRKAINAANNAVRDGILIRQPCEGCGATERIHKHHDDYSKPLEVRWLCAKCHHAEHK